MTTVFHSRGEGELRQVSEHEYLLGAYRSVLATIADRLSSTPASVEGIIAIDATDDRWIITYDADCWHLVEVAA